MYPLHSIGKVYEAGALGIIDGRRASLSDTPGPLLLIAIFPPIGTSRSIRLL